MSRTPTNTHLSALSLCIGLAGLGVATAATSPGTAPATGDAMKSTATVAAGDKTFAQKAAIGGLAEVAMGKLAQEKAGSDQVKQFSSRMADDHAKANDELKQVASSKGLTLPTDLDAKHKSKVARLEKLSGAQFDRAYMDEMVSDHKQDISEFEQEAKSGHDNDIKGFASKTLPTLQEHLKMAQDTDAAVKGKKTASR